MLITIIESKIIEIYNQGIAKIINAIQRLTVEIRTQNHFLKLLKSQVNKNNSKFQSDDRLKNKIKI